jgi:hypothetical protein
MYPEGSRRKTVTFIGYAIVLVVVTVSILAGGASLFTVRLAGASAVTIGSILLGAMTMRARVLPWWCGVLLIVGFPLGDVSNAIVAEGSEAFVFGIVWGLVGYALLTSSSALDQ